MPGPYRTPHYPIHENRLHKILTVHIRDQNHSFLCFFSLFISHNIWIHEISLRVLLNILSCIFCYSIKKSIQIFLELGQHWLHVLCNIIEPSVCHSEIDWWTESEIFQQLNWNTNDHRYEFIMMKRNLGRKEKLKSFHL